MTVSVGSRDSSAASFAASSSWAWRSRESSSIRSERDARACAASGSVDEASSCLQPCFDRLQPRCRRLDAGIRLLRRGRELFARALDGARELLAGDGTRETAVEGVEPGRELVVGVAIAGELLDPLGESGEGLRRLRVGGRGEPGLEPRLDRLEP